jgi:hypothetical protein
MMDDLNCWQIFAGAEGRDYTDECLRLGMAFVGGEEHVRTIQRIRSGDLILLRKPGRGVVAVGVAEDRHGHCSGNATLTGKEWLGDFDGWALHGYCYVDWYRLQQPVPAGRARTIELVTRGSKLRALAESIVGKEPSLRQTVGYDLEPNSDEVRRLTDEEIISFLIGKGLRPGAAEELSETVQRIRRLARYYYETEGLSWRSIREHETRTFLVVPLLLALGWSEQRLKIEFPAGGRRRIDIACFETPYRNRNTDCKLIIETKGFDKGLSYAHGQAKHYARSYPDCELVLATNGFCYKAFHRMDEESFSSSPTAYLNILEPRLNYPIRPAIGGALPLLEALLPN